MKNVFFFLTFLFSYALYAEEEPTDLTIVSWGGALQNAQRQVFFEPFAKESGKKIKEESYNGGLSEIEAMLKKDKSDWDLVQVEAVDLIVGCGKHLFESLNWNKIGQRSEFVRGTTNNCGVGAILWAMVMAYDDTVFPEHKPKDWVDFWDIKKFPGKRGLRKSARFTYEIALLALGAKGTDVYSALRVPNASEKIHQKLDEIYPFIEWWEDGGQPTQWLQTKNVSMTAAYNGRVTDAVKWGNAFKMSWKDAIYSIDYWAILNNSQNKDAAYQLLRFMSVPQRHAEFTELITYAPPMKRSYRMIKRETQLLLPDVQNKMGAAFAMDVNFWAVAGEKLEAEFQAWLKKKEAPDSNIPKIVPNLPNNSAFVPKSGG